MSRVVLSEQQHGKLDVDRAATMRVHAPAAAKRAAIVKEDDHLTQADIQANPVKIAKSLHTELMTWFDNERFQMQGISKASNIMTPKCACN
eukprot:3044236-Pyramimonas_sp.AAC.1